MSVSFTNDSFLMDESALRRDVLIGLSQEQKTIAPKYLYDDRGSKLFERLCEIREYYLNRAERKILKTHSREIGHLIGEHAVLIEPGAGNLEKVKLLLPYLKQPMAYLPIDISPEILKRSATELAHAHPELTVIPLVGDYTEEFSLPVDLLKDAGKRVVFFPGSTIGNMDPAEAQGMLRRLAKWVGPGGGLLVGVDLKKDIDILLQAYDDPHGVTAAFDLNILHRLNRELSANFVPENFRHEARYNERLGRVEMHLVSQTAQIVQIGGKQFHFEAGESIHTENSYKYSVSEFCAMGEKADLKIQRFWMDAEHLFCVYYFEIPS